MNVHTCVHISTSTLMQVQPHIVHTDDCLAKKSSFFTLSFSSQVLNSNGWVGVRKQAGGRALWREVNLFLQSTDRERTNDTVGIKFIFKFDNICKLM